MKLESALKYFNPKSQQYDATTPAKGSDSLTGTDLMGAVGFCQSKAPFGISAVLAKSTGNNEETYRAVEQLLQYANRTAPNLLRKAAGAKLGRCLVVLSKLAFEEYARSASSTASCQHCNGNGFNHVLRSVVKYPGYVSAVDGEEKIPPRFVQETVREKCSHCDGKGRVSARCRCNGTGRVRDLEASKRQGSPVEKECERCSGRGFKRSPRARAYRAVSALVPDLQERTWNRNWKPFFDKLVTKCEIEEAYADSVFHRATK
ncbi:antitermination protein [Pantoea ananatis]|uniref:antitermination protein Q n=1 Tax=Pantoea ananas TaxID=553 RepID=UPI002350E369|nr:antitermination protein [Pantoea ananatis]MDC7862236.1 molecular chaperone [Pantoea ananatis]